MYLFGASPALDRSFLRHEVPGLMQLDDHTLAFTLRDLPSGWAIWVIK